MVGIFSFIAVTSCVAIVIAIIQIIICTLKKKSKKPFTIMATISVALFFISFIGVNMTYHPTPEQIAERERIAAEKEEQKRIAAEKKEPEHLTSEKAEPETTTATEQTTTETTTVTEQTTAETTTATETTTKENIDKKEIYNYFNNLLGSSENPYKWTEIGNEDLEIFSDEWKKITEEWQQACDDYEENAMKDTADKFGITVEEVESIFFENVVPRQTSFDIKFGTFLEAIETSDNGLVIKAKIQPNYNNKATINQNYYNIEDIIKNQEGDKYEYIDYWAVADMQDGSESKVISFIVDRDLIQNIVEEQVFAIELGDHVKDLWILPSLLQ